MDGGWDSLLKHVPRSTNTNKSSEDWDALTQFLPSVPPASQQQEDWDSLLALLPPSSVEGYNNESKDRLYGQTRPPDTPAAQDKVEQSPSPQKPNLRDELDKSKEENNKLCCICLDQPKSIVLLPCGHICVCEGCGKSVQQCPLCRENVQGRSKVYW